MAVLSYGEIMDIVNQHITGTDDASLKAIEDISDTMQNITNVTDKAAEVDAAWRQKYRDRFFSRDPQDTTPPTAPTGSTVLDVTETVVDETPDWQEVTYSDLFTEKGE